MNEVWGEARIWNRDADCVAVGRGTLRMRQQIAQKSAKIGEQLFSVVLPVLNTKKQVTGLALYNQADEKLRLIKNSDQPVRNNIKRVLIVVEALDAL